MKTQNARLGFAGLGLLAVGAVVGWSAPPILKSSANGTPTSSAAIAAVPSPIPLGTAPNYRGIVAQNRDAVVGITVEGRMKVADRQQGDLNPFGDDDELAPFFRRFRGVPGPQGDAPMRGQGSGFIVSPDGIVLTNAHVVEGSEHVSVKLADRREFDAKVLGADKATDVAVLKIDARNLPVVRLGDSNELNVGDYVLAIGAPFGLEETATAGIVSAKARSLPGDGTVPFIQTDAAVNPGNSGGPLFDSSGAVVGINSQIYTSSGGYQGVSFAIPINLAANVRDQIVKTGNVQHGRLGVEVQTVTQALAQSFKLKSPGGALVAKVEPGGAAEKAGLQAGDVILSYDGQPIVESGDLASRVSIAPPGKRVDLEISRNGKPMTLTAKVGAASTAGLAADNAAPAGEQPRLGLAVRPLTEAERAQSGTDAGLLVQGVQGKAAAAGIEQGDVVIAVDGTEVRTVEQLRELSKKQGKSVALLIQRGANRIYVPIALG
jgi:serine protease Do